MTRYSMSEFDARGDLTKTVERKISGSGGGSTYVDEIYTTEQSYDAAGQKTKRKVTDYTYNEQTGTTNVVTTGYFVNSSVTGKMITALDSVGAKTGTSVYFGEALMASHSITATSNQVFFSHADPMTGSTVATFASGQFTGSRKHYEPLGGLISDNPPAGGEFGVFKNYENGGNVFDPGYGCEWDGGKIPCELVPLIVRSQEVKDIQVRYQGYERGGQMSPISLQTHIDWLTEQTSVRVCEKDNCGPWEFGPASHFFKQSVANQSDGNRGTKLTDKELKKLAEDIQLVFDANPDCLPFIQGILGEARTDENPLVSQNPFDVFWAVRNQVGFYKVDDLPAGGYNWGNIARGTAKIEFLARNATLEGRGISEASKQRYRRGQELISASTVLNEVIHASGAFSYNDIEMSLATASHMKIPPPDYPRSRPPKGKSVTAWIFSWSNWWHPKVLNKCSPLTAQKYERSRR